MELKSLSFSIPHSELLKIQFIQELHKTESSDISHVSYEGRESCLKAICQFEFEPFPLNNVNNG